MATRAPKGAARPRGGTTGRGRPAAASGRTSGNRSSGSSRGAGGRGSGGARGRGGAGSRGGTPYYRSRGPASRRGAASRLRESTNPFVILIGWIVAAVAAVWMELASGVGFVARHFGASARELDPAHRRDGAGLAVLAAAFIAAGAAWWHLGSPVGRVLTGLVRGSFGVGASVIPVLLVLLAWRLLRHPDKN